MKCAKKNPGFDAPTGFEKQHTQHTTQSKCFQAAEEKSSCEPLLS
jgi:hypothetical protein